MNTIKNKQQHLLTIATLSTDISKIALNCFNKESVYTAEDLIKLEMKLDRQKDSVRMLRNYLNKGESNG